jgi:hypothetical protein
MVSSQTGKKGVKAAATATGIVSHMVLSLGASHFMELEREVEQAYRPMMLKALEESAGRDGEALKPSTAMYVNLPK